MEEEINLIDNDNSQPGKVNWRSGVAFVFQCSKRWHDNLTALPLSGLNQVWNFDVRVFGQFSVDISDLGCELSNVHDAENLRFLKRGIYSHHGANRKSARLSRPVFGLSYQVLVVAIFVFAQNERNSDRLYMRGP